MNGRSICLSAATTKPPLSKTVPPLSTVAPKDSKEPASEHREEHPGIVFLPRPIADGIRRGMGSFFRRLEDDYSQRLMEHGTRYAVSPQEIKISLDKEGRVYEKQRKREIR